MKCSFTPLAAVLAVLIGCQAPQEAKQEPHRGVFQASCEPDSFVLQRYEARMASKTTDFVPDQEREFWVLDETGVNPQLEARAAVYPKEAGEVRLSGNSELLLTAHAAPTGARVELGFYAPTREGIDLSDFRNGALYFSIKGPPHADIRYQLEASGGMFNYGQTSAQPLLLNGDWQEISLPLHQFDRMIAPGARYVTPLDGTQITAPFKLSLFTKDSLRLSLASIRLHTRPPAAQDIPSSVAIHFDQPLQAWDGFGVNYVQSSRSRDYEQAPEDYSGFSQLSEAQRREVVELVFGEDGLQPALVKMFLDPLHQARDVPEITPSNLAEAFDHETTTNYMRFFVREGLKLTRQQGRDLSILAGLYGPPAWATQQKFVRGRDLDTTQYVPLAEYMASWVKYLQEVEGLPVDYLSIHNEGDSPRRWDAAGKTAGKASHDHNAFWRPQQVADFVKVLDATLEQYELGEVGVTPGEYNTWHKFYSPGVRHFSYARALYEAPESLEVLDLLTSHSFWNPKDEGILLIRLKRPELHAWTTSMAWNWGARADVSFLDFVRRELYEVKVNGLINWAISYAPNQWVPSYPDPGVGIFIDQGEYRIEPAYYYYKQLTRAGRRGTRVARAISPVPKVQVIAFTGSHAQMADAFVVYNLDQVSKQIRLELSGTPHQQFEGFMNQPCAYEVPLGIHPLNDGKLTLELEPYTSVVFFGK